MTKKEIENVIDKIQSSDQVSIEPKEVKCPYCGYTYSYEELMLITYGLKEDK